MGRSRITVVAVAALAFVLPASASAWQLKFSDYFQLSGVEAANEIHDSLVKFFNMSHTKLSPDQQHLQFKQNGLELGGEEVIEPGISSAPFKPKPGC